MPVLSGNSQPDDASLPVELVQEKSDQFNWVFFAVIATFHLGAVAALFSFHWSSIVVFLALWLLSQNVGIAVSYHRQLTHRSFTTPKWLEYCLAVCGALALQGSPVYWVAVHRLHHQYTDKPGDPHSPREGKWWSHMGWILHGALHSETTMLSRYAPDLERDRFYRWLAVWHWPSSYAHRHRTAGRWHCPRRIAAGNLVGAVGRIPARFHRLPRYLAR
ncbi:MAG TPA: fatty acid desaturase [Terracidiphilus sp.]|nr:fatty acid desaturase [Terracidiphilus sp.]